MPYLVFDTETTGLPDFRAPSDAPHQPHLVQFAAVLLSEQFHEWGRFHCLVRPAGWEIPPEVAAIHGISANLAHQFGVEEALVSSLFWKLAAIPGVTLVGHNLPFDMRIMRIALLRAGVGKELQEEHLTAPRYCTMEAARPIIQLPPTAKMRGGFKAPRLSEAYLHFFGEEFIGAHDAMVDTLACARVFQHLKTMEPN